MRNQKGQAILEYILLLSVIVGITYLLMSKFREGMNCWIIKGMAPEAHRQSQIGRLVKDFRPGSASFSGLWNLPGTASFGTSSNGSSGCNIGIL